MDTSTYFGLNLVTGSDKVNPLTVDRPNYEKIDEQMHKNQIAGVVEATELKSDTVHAITCLTENAVFFRFTATSDFSAGDTFTFNGTPVTAVLPDGTYLPEGVFKTNGTVLCSVIGTLLTVYSFRTSEEIGNYTHTKNESVNNITGSGTVGKVMFTENVADGDTFTVNGVPATAYCGTMAADKVLSFGEWKNKYILFIYMNNTIFFVSDTTTKPTENVLKVLDPFTIDVEGATYFKSVDGVVTVNFAIRGDFKAYPEVSVFAELPEGFRPSHSVITSAVQQGIEPLKWSKVIVGDDGKIRYFSGAAAQIISGTVTFLAK